MIVILSEAKDLTPEAFAMQIALRESPPVVGIPHLVRDDNASKAMVFS